MQVKSIQEIVNAQLTFSFGTNNKGWNKIFCEVCGDGSRSKGPRGGWLFVDEMCFYNCFNCGVDGNFDPNREQPHSKDMRRIFESFKIPTSEVKSLIFSKKLRKNKPTNPQHKQTPFSKLEIPNHFYLLSEADDDNVIADKAKQYLKTRHVDYNSYPFYLSTGISLDSNPGIVSKTKLLTNRIIIPSFRNNSMVYYQARSLDPKSKIPYINADVPRGSIIYGFDKLYVDAEHPLFVTEGFFDAYHLNGVAVLENKLSTAQIEILNKSPRQKVIVPDQNGDSNKLVDQAIALGWSFAIPDIGSGCKDIDEGITKYGKLYVLDSVYKNIRHGQAAKIFI